MFTQLLFIATTVASASAIWRKLLNDLPAFKSRLSTHLPYPANRALTCGFCFTYWTSLIAVFIFDPLEAWRLPLRFTLAYPFEQTMHLFMSWMIVGFATVTLRFLFVALQELVDYEMYTMNRQFHDPNREHSHGSDAKHENPSQK